ncbi:DUF4126 domain-containing protein [Galbibacter mesophilus]|uniref:DUF4126 domain-containing protein n=1 Tax=Galbibacter mesophilus TaxID=379069 RepID=UPI0019200846|nr:DUF4126 domain-containing protein [Galbibacter mesophilus]MCM5662879.1 DUF4126 domain-containing protein [Galbibacter mesophilus]
MTSETIISIFLGVGLAASAGFRVFLPLFILSLAAHFNVIDVSGNWEWIGSVAAIITLGVAMLFEIFAYYIPFVDNALDTIAVPLAAIAGTAVMVSTIAELSPVVTWAMAIIAGGGTATLVKGASAGTRLTSSATTAGLGNPVVSTVETGSALFMSVVSVFFPFLAVIFTILILLLIFWFYKKLRPSKN